MSKPLMFAPLALALAAAAPPVPARDPSLADVLAATQRFRDDKVAETEGYVREPTNTCETADMMGRPIADGAMGVHYLRPDLLGITAPPNPRVDGNGTHTDFLKPGVLIYEPRADGSMELVAVENLVFAKSWHAAGHTKPPSFQGVPFDPMVDDPATPLDEAHGLPALTTRAARIITTPRPSGAKSSARHGGSNLRAVRSLPVRRCRT